MRWRGIHYDVGTAWVPGALSREALDRSAVERDLDAIAGSLRCNAVRVSGQAPDRLVLVAEEAIERGLEVWFSPARVDASPQETLTYFEACASAAEELRGRGPEVVFVAGCELSLFMGGILDGAGFLDRLATLTSLWRIARSTVRRGSLHAGLERFFAEAIPRVRARFGGRVSYASGSWEEIDWSRFDLVGVDHYRDARNTDRYAEILRGYLAHGKPVVVTEFGCCPYTGADQQGGTGWTVVDWEADPPRIRAPLVRDEQVQVRCLRDAIEVFEAEGLAGAFWYTF